LRTERRAAATKHGRFTPSLGGFHYTGGTVQQQDLRYERAVGAEHTAVITLDRPSASNAYSTEMIDSLVNALDAAEDDDDVWAVILTGAGKAFSAGGDLRAMQARTGMFAGDSVRLRTAYTRHIQRVPRRLHRFEKPIIAAINGPAIGAGLDLACMAEFRLAAQSATFGSTFVKVGLVPGDGGAYFLSRAVGYTHAARMVLTGKVIDAAEALRIGLVSEVVADADLMEAAHRLARELTACSPLAVRLAKQALCRSWDSSLDQALELAATYQCVVQRTPDHEEGVQALLERRPPQFKG
jgi:enoyl-CoA hydratase/carnithine racemase